MTFVGDCNVVKFFKVFSKMTFNYEFIVGITDVFTVECVIFLILNVFNITSVSVYYPPHHKKETTWNWLIKHVFKVKKCRIKK